MNLTTAHLTLEQKKSSHPHISKRFPVILCFCRIFDLQYDMKNGKVRKGMIKGQTEVN